MMYVLSVMWFVMLVCGGVCVWLSGVVGERVFKVSVMV